MFDVPGVGRGWHPVGARDADEEAHRAGDCVAGEGCQFEEETHAVPERAGVGCRKMVGGGRERGVQKVAVGGVDFDCLGSGIRKELRKGDENLHQNQLSELVERRRERIA